MKQDIPCVSLDLPYLNGDTVSRETHEEELMNPKFKSKRGFWEWLPNDVVELCKYLVQPTEKLSSSKLEGVEYYRRVK